MMSLLLYVLTDRHSQQYPPQVCLLEQRPRLHCLWGRRWAAQSAQVGNAVRWLHTHPLCFVLKFPPRPGSVCWGSYASLCVSEWVCVESHHWMSGNMLTDGAVILLAHWICRSQNSLCFCFCFRKHHGSFTLNDSFTFFCKLCYVLDFFVLQCYFGNRTDFKKVVATKLDVDVIRRHLSFLASRISKHALFKVSLGTYRFYILKVSLLFIVQVHFYVLMI